MSATVAEALSIITPSPAFTDDLDTSKWFDAGHADKNQSPIDEFRDNLYEINRLYLTASQEGKYTRVMGSLSYLGLVSAFESYIRALLRRLILVDEVCRNNAEKRVLTYAAAKHHHPDLLPEALLEGISFASTRSVALELRTLCSITQMGKDGQVPPNLKAMFSAFEAICQVRHCGIHRFGKLGSNQALTLGMESHKPVLEKPLSLSVENLQSIAQALEALACGLNSYCFFDILKRTHQFGPAGNSDMPAYKVAWQLDFEADRERFFGYYSMFASTKKPNVSPEVEVVYAAFIDFISKANPNSKAGIKQAVVAETGD